MPEVAIGSPSNAQAARSALTLACRRVGIIASRAELVRLGSNAVFRLDADTIARVASPLARRDNAIMQVAASRWLVSIGYPATAALDVDQPVGAGGRIVTFWKSVAPETEYAPIDQVADLIRRLHELPPPEGIDFPELRPFGDPDDSIPTFDGLAEEDAAFLCDRFAWARQTFPTLDFQLEPGLIHGDANVGNVLLDERGQAVLIDLDNFSVGPREWDLIQTALFADRLGWHTEEEYRTFVEVYGHDIKQWDGYETLADIREVAMTAWMAKKAADDQGAAAEVHKRITAMRSGGSRRDWGAY